MNNGIELRMAALGKAYELQQFLQKVTECPEYGEGSCPAFALEALDEVIAYLIPSPADDDEEDDPGAPRLRLVGGRVRQ